jgi:hypothetical protein
MEAAGSIGAKNRSNKSFGGLSATRMRPTSWNRSLVLRDDVRAKASVGLVLAKSGNRFVDSR